MQRVNDLAQEIRQSPKARDIISNPKVYATEINMAKSKAAEERYQAGLLALEVDGKDAARDAYGQFFRANEIVPGYEDVIEKMAAAKEIGTIKVVMEAIPVHDR